MILLHETTREFIFATKRNRLHMRFQICENLPVKCRIIYWNRFHKNDVFSLDVPCLGQDGYRKYYECDIDFDETVSYIQYYFELEINGKTAYWGRNGYDSQKPAYFFEYLATAELDLIEVPEWAKGTVWYQIFPERFLNGNKVNDPADIAAWDEVPTRENFFGGDLAGIIRNMPYLKDLGVDVIYMTPIFAAITNHKYDTVDYFKIDPSFGTLADFKKLVSVCHELEIKVVLDGVFNHIGYYSQQFQDVIEKGKDSCYADWFYIKGFPIETNPLNYECVGYHQWMPKLKMKTRAVRDFFVEVGRYWLEECDIDGWRLDVADEIDFTFLQEFRREIKAVRPDAFLLAETWKDGRDMLRGDQVDSVMNYLFRDAVIDFFAKRKISAASFGQRISQMLFGYSKAVRPVLYNTIGSHDTARFLTVCQGDLVRLKLALGFQMAFPGMPAIYYGDEIGMDGENDPDCRKAMAWDKADKNLLDFVKRLTSLRKEFPCLKYGDFKCLYAHEAVFAFTRSFQTETALVIINNSEKTHQARIPLWESKEEIAEMKTVFKYDSIELETLYNHESFGSKPVFEMELNQFHFEIIKIRRN
ncbi:MAG: glycoside hydrolase family 13 protein [Lachnospiraceae bacterium]|nr:glycoside hydrolase family 13 protein [Lachnospiraceae bacterium]